VVKASLNATVWATARTTECACETAGPSGTATVDPPARRGTSARRACIPTVPHPGWLRLIGANTNRTSPHPDRACSLAGPGAVRELDAADVPPPSNVGLVELTGRGNRTHLTIALEPTQTSQLTRD
jgi:hypothetical protein